jgi:hypothetical protein
MLQAISAEIAQLMTESKEFIAVLNPLGPVPTRNEATMISP